MLGVHYMTAYRYVRTGKLPATWSGGTWHVTSADLDVARASSGRPASALPAFTGQTVPKSVQARLQRRLVAGDEAGAWVLVEAVLGGSMTPTELLLDLLSPTLASIGDAWARGDLSVADEHTATAVSSRLIGRLGARFSRRGVKRGVVALASPSGELHGLPVAMCADLLRWHGFDPIELGANTPAESMAEVAGRHRDLLGLAVACTTNLSLEPAREALGAAREAAPDLPLLLGGAAVVDADHARALGADVFTGRRGDRLLAAVADLASHRR